jgi:hypothetical protein
MDVVEGGKLGCVATMSDGFAPNGDTTSTSGQQDRRTVREGSA